VQHKSALNLLDFRFPGTAFASPKYGRRWRRGKDNHAFPGEPEQLSVLHFGPESSHV
jgi:hypothetical protein